MKKYYLLLSAMMLALVFAGCNNTENPEETEKKFSIDPQEINCPDVGGEYTVMLTSPTTNKWTAKSDNAWVTVSPTEGTGDSEVRIKISTNKESAESTSKVTFTDGKSTIELPIRRAAKAAPQLRVTSEKEINTPREGGTYTIQIESNIQWQVDKSANWVTLDKGMGKNNGSVTMTIAAATTPEQTTATVTVSQYTGSGATAQTITITRGGTDATSLSVDNPTIEAPADGGNYTINVESNARWKAEQAWDTEDWITIFGTTSTEGNGSFGITVEPAKTVNERTGVITITEVRKDNYPPVTVQIQILRAGKAAASLSVSPTTINAPAEGGDYAIEIKSNYPWTATGIGAKYFSMSITSGSGDATMVVYVKADTEHNEATGSITIKSTFGDEKETIKIRREAAPVEPEKPEQPDPVFSVWYNKKVYFSPGNLQYQPSTKTWRFAKEQYDMCATDNSSISATSNKWIDLFGWGTGNYPTLCTKEDDDYFGFTDWGTNAISNGGNKAKVWRTLNGDEWKHLFHTRENAENLRSGATVKNVHGYIFLPDNWVVPEGIKFTANKKDWDTNTYSETQWIEMENAGAIFLPAAGVRWGTEVNDSGTGNFGEYWSSSIYEDSYELYNRAYLFRFGIDFSTDEKKFTVNMYTKFKSYGCSVRLVQDVK